MHLDELGSIHRELEASVFQSNETTRRLAPSPTGSAEGSSKRHTLWGKPKSNSRRVPWLRSGKKAPMPNAANLPERAFPTRLVALIPNTTDDSVVLLPFEARRARGQHCRGSCEIGFS